MEDDAMKSIVQINYGNEDDEDHLVVCVEEVLDAAYGCYIWPSALVMGDYVWYHRHDLFSNAVVLEMGAGTSLPSLILAKGQYASRLILTDLPSALPVIRSCLSCNNIEESDKLWVRPLLWGELGSEHGVDRLVEKVKAQWHTSVDYILGSDTFYDPADFEKLLMTVAYIILKHNPKCKFITSYQERSAKRSIQYLLDRWQLHCRLIPRDSFFNEDRFSGHEHPVAAKVNAGTLASVFLLEISAKN
ncbi:putative methyltransferase-domain-containing protein [Radiomyces spectabilis]|uniref:putative methyltransferase-domain-containing protein n=1 Tax=Radiomyces spectabilis TaxID=64574 RepID=UPI00221F51D0|nr:putative methyltransferase-domain-containing protein [Radiomyces spectabilis]KAI8374112.1 putative methyltransferase-domain-containing protein [Radiomyces spectabilis]